MKATAEPKSPSTTDERMRHWRAMSRPPVHALKEIKGGRLSGMTDVNPQWRYQAMTEQFGMCGIGWKYTIDKMWTEAGTDGEVLAFAQVSLQVFVDDSWGEPVIGVGGNHLITKESKGLRNNDECWKMAITDALSVAMKMLGVAADIYAGRWDGSKYREPEPPTADSTEHKQSYGDWLTDIEAKTADGYAALVKAVAESHADYKDKLRKDKERWARFEAKAKRAEMVGVA